MSAPDANRTHDDDDDEGEEKINSNNVNTVILVTRLSLVA